MFSKPLCCHDSRQNDAIREIFTGSFGYDPRQFVRRSETTPLQVEASMLSLILCLLPGMMYYTSTVSLIVPLVQRKKKLGVGHGLRVGYRTTTKSNASSHHDFLPVHEHETMQPCALLSSTRRTNFTISTVHGTTSSNNILFAWHNRTSVRCWGAPTKLCTPVYTGIPLLWHTRERQGRTCEVLAYQHTGTPVITGKR